MGVSHSPRDCAMTASRIARDRRRPRLDGAADRVRADDFHAARILRIVGSATLRPEMTATAGAVERSGLARQDRRDGDGRGRLDQVLVLVEHEADGVEDLLLGQQGDAVDARAAGPRSRSCRCRPRGRPPSSRPAAASARPRPVRARARGRGRARAGSRRCGSRAGPSSRRRRTRRPGRRRRRAGGTSRAAGQSSRTSAASVPPLAARMSASSKAVRYGRPVRSASARASARSRRSRRSRSGRRRRRGRACPGTSTRRRCGARGSRRGCRARAPRRRRPCRGCRPST